MLKEIDLLDKYDKNKPIWDCMTGKEVKRLQYNIKKEMDKMQREADHWRAKQHGSMKIVKEKRIEFEQQWRMERKAQLKETFDHIESQIKDWYMPCSNTK